MLRRLSINCSRILNKWISTNGFKFSSKVETNKNLIWSLGKLNHIALATPNLEGTTTLYRNVLGAKVSDAVPLPEHGVTTVFVELQNTKLELLAPLGDKSPIKNFLMKNVNGGIHHICLEVDNIQAAMKHLKAMNVRCLSDKPQIGAHGKPVVFLHPKDLAGVLIELEEA